VAAGEVSAPADNSAANAAAGLRANSRWRVDYGENNCRALRSYGNGEDAIVLDMSRAASFDAMDISIAGRNIPRMGRVEYIGLRVDNVTQENMPAETWTLPDRLGRVIMLRLSIREFVPRLRAAQSLRFALPEGREIALELTQLEGVMTHLDRCHAQLLSSWGIDPAALGQLRSLPVPLRPSQWIEGQLLPGFTGRASAAVLIQVSPEGRATSCRTLDGSGEEEIDERVCRQIMQRARLRPAIGPNGQPVAAPHFQRIRFQG
jgi:hypothetical protein